MNEERADKFRDLMDDFGKVEFTEEFFKEVHEIIKEENARYEIEKKRFAPTQEQMNKRFTL